MAVSDSPEIPIICGPTASGKTGIAVRLAHTYPIEVVGADSRQIIRRLDIGTAKPTPEERQAAPMNLIDLIDPGGRYSAFRFIDDAEAAIADILGRGSIPVVVGGTGLYLRALSEGIVEIDDDNLKIRRRLEEQMRKEGPEVMHGLLQRIDPLEAEQVHPNNHVRVIRALEVFYLTGRCKSELMHTDIYRRPAHRYQFYRLMPPRDELYERINRRVDQMLAQGLLDEIRGLIEDGLAEATRESRVIGYVELLDYLHGFRSLEEAIGLIKQNTRRYAKRQYTWLRHQVEGPVFTEPDSLEAELAQKLDNW